MEFFKVFVWFAGSIVVLSYLYDVLDTLHKINNELVAARENRDI
jgi:hypothetical protein